jgi:MOSC domain-containing protein YiiM
LGKLSQQSCALSSPKTSKTGQEVQKGHPAVKLVSLNVGRPRLMVYQGRTINTGIFKQPVAGPVPLRTLNLDDDRQADLSVHGGPFKAVYGCPSEHYPLWREELPGMDLPWGANFPWGSFGENFTTEGLFESDLHIGDRLRIGSAILTVRQPRMPCYKLVAKFQRDDMIDLFVRSGRSGFYFSVEQEGVVENGQAFEFLSHEPQAITIAEMNRLFVEDRYNHALLDKAIATPALPEDWREYLAKRLAGAVSAEP